jgi:hypothetical protein
MRAGYSAARRVVARMGSAFSRVRGTTAQKASWGVCDSWRLNRGCSDLFRLRLINDPLAQRVNGSLVLFYVSV